MIAANELEPASVFDWIAFNMTMDSQQQANLLIARRMLWLYCIVWLLEGAVRKWVLPQYSLELLLVRDPLVVVIYFFAARARVFPSNSWLTFLWITTCLIAIQGFVQAAAGGVTWVVAVFGLRTFILHMPLIWIVPALFGRKEIETLGKWVLFIAPFLALLMVVQFEVGPEHWLNAASIKGGSQLGSVAGRIRPPAVFSFITGPVCYFSLTTVYAIGGILTGKGLPKWLIAFGAVSTLIAMSVSASRWMVIGIAIITIAGAFASVSTGKQTGAVVALVVGIFIAVPVLFSVGILREGVTAFVERWGSEDESGITGGKLMTQRVGGGFLSAFEWAGRVPTFGFGVGSTSNLALEKSAFVTETEGEWERVIFEIGPITGFAYLAFRAALAIRLLSLGFGLLRSGNFYCLLFGTAAFADILFGNLRQVTTLGYMSICGGLCLAAHKAFSGEKESHIYQQLEGIAAEKPRLRGRGRFAVGGKPVEP